MSTQHLSMCLCTLGVARVKVQLTLCLPWRFAKGHLSEPVSGRRRPGHLSRSNPRGLDGVGIAGTRDTASSKY